MIPVEGVIARPASQRKSKADTTRLRASRACVPTPLASRRRLRRSKAQPSEPLALEHPPSAVPFQPGCIKEN